MAPTGGDGVQFALRGHERPPPAEIPLKNEVYSVQSETTLKRAVAALRSDDDFEAG